MWKGDQVAACVAAASMIAKVTRDALMCELDLQFPDYGFSRHKGYSTRSHMRALDEHGPCPEHRKSFVNVRGRIPADWVPVRTSSSRLDLTACSKPDLMAWLEAVDLSWSVRSGRRLVRNASPDNSEAANSCYPSGTGQNGPIVDIIEEHGWPTAGLAAMARGA